MNRWIPIIVIIFAAVSVLAWLERDYYQVVVTPVYEKFVSSEPKRDVYLGFWTHGFWDDNTRSLNPKKLQDLESKVGKKAAIAHYFRGWHHLEEASMAADLNTISQYGWRPMISANPYFFDDCTAKGATLYKAISIGNCDEVMRKMARNLKTVKEPFFLRFAWEMNVNSMEWSIQRTASWNEEFVNSWIRFHNIMREEGVTNAIWVFSPQIETKSTIDISELYPGDAYVDWVGLDGYNWGETQNWSNWQDFSSVFLDSYNKLRGLAPTKPFMIAEVNTTDVGGDKALWYKDMLAHQIPDVFTEIDAVVFFDEDKSKVEGVKWTIDSSAEALSEFKEGIKDPLYKSKF